MTTKMLTTILVDLYLLYKGSSTTARNWLDRSMELNQTYEFYFARFEVLTAVLAKITVFWDIMSYQLTKCYRRVERTNCCLFECQQSNKRVSSYTARLWTKAQISTRCKLHNIICLNMQMQINEVALIVKSNNLL
jgi:hypothetical protein